MLEFDLESINRNFRGKSPRDIIDFAIHLSHRRVVTTSFGTYSAVLLSALSNADPRIPVIWCDTGYNNAATYDHANFLIKDLDLNIRIYSPQYTRGYLDSLLGLPTVGTPEHERFTELVKLEPFRRALKEWEPEIWFTNIRTKQTRHRDSKDIFSYSEKGILKVSPFYHCSDAELDSFLREYDLPKNGDYFDPVKALESRECGIHLV